MLSKNAVKLLKWMNKHDKWIGEPKISAELKHYNRRSLKALVGKEYLNKQYVESDSHWVEYRINDSGIAYLEGAKHARMTNVREWLSFGLSVSAIVISIIALLMQAEIL